VGSGGSFYEAAFAMKAAIPAGAYHVVLDSICIVAVDTKFDLIYRTASGDTSLATWTRHWDPLPGGVYDAQAYELDVDAPATGFHSGDQLVFRYTGMNASMSMAYIPNGDGAITHGRIPSITIPP
jgi:hypothetical protein